MTDLSFECLDARVEPYALAPTLTFRFRITERTGIAVHAVALLCQFRVEPNRRRYSDSEAERLHDLFGDRSRWADTLKPLQFATVSTMVPAFTGSVEVDVPVPCTADLEVAAGRYFHALDDGEAPFLVLFSGSVFAERGEGYQVTRISWNAEAPHRLPVAVWRKMTDLYFPDSAWIPLTRGTLDALIRFKSARGLPTWNHVIETLLAEAGPIAGSTQTTEESP